MQKREQWIEQQKKRIEKKSAEFVTVCNAIKREVHRLVRALYILFICDSG